MADSKKNKKNKKDSKSKKKEAPKRTTAELLQDAKDFVSANKSPAYKRIQEVVEATPSGRPARVVISCSDPQKNGSDVSVCDDLREIAIQDLHQVLRCVPCQKRSVQVYRNKLATRRRAELRKHRGDDKPKAAKTTKTKSKKKNSKK